MKTLLKYLLVTIILCNIQSCIDHGDPKSEMLREIEAKVGDQKWVGEGSYLIAFGNDPQLFSLNCRNDSSQFNIELRASGPGTYTTVENGYYFSWNQKTTFEITTASVTISKVTHTNKATGSFEFSAKDEISGKVITVKEGKFNDVNGLGYW
jgi:hypothetical protein